MGVTVLDVLGGSAVRYALVKGRGTGLELNDPAPVHSECEAPLIDVGDNKWLCGECAESGRLLLSPEVTGRRQPTPAEQMQVRWGALPARAPFRQPPPHFIEWQDYFDDCFPDGVLWMRAHDDAEHTVRDDTEVVLSSRVIVAETSLNHADLVITDLYVDRPLYLRRAFHVVPVAPGVLAVGNDQGQWSRLDAHLLDEEKHAVSDRRRGGYFGLYEHPTDANQEGS